MLYNAAGDPVTVVSPVDTAGYVWTRDARHPATDTTTMARIHREDLSADLGEYEITTTLTELTPGGPPLTFDQTRAILNLLREADINDGLYIKNLATGEFRNVTILNQDTFAGLLDTLASWIIGQVTAGFAHYAPSPEPHMRMPRFCRYLEAHFVLINERSDHGTVDLTQPVREISADFLHGAREDVAEYRCEWLPGTVGTSHPAEGFVYLTFLKDDEWSYYLYMCRDHARTLLTKAQACHVTVRQSALEEDPHVES